MPRHPVGMAVEDAITLGDVPWGERSTSRRCSSCRHQTRFSPPPRRAGRGYPSLIGMPTVPAEPRPGRPDVVGEAMSLSRCATTHRARCAELNAVSRRCSVGRVTTALRAPRMPSGAVALRQSRQPHAAHRCGIALPRGGAPQSAVAAGRGRRIWALRASGGRGHDLGAMGACRAAPVVLPGPRCRRTPRKDAPRFPCHAGGPPHHAGIAVHARAAA